MVGDVVQKKNPVIKIADVHYHSISKNSKTCFKELFKCTVNHSVGYIGTVHYGVTDRLTSQLYKLPL